MSSPKYDWEFIDRLLLRCLQEIGHPVTTMQLAALIHGAKCGYALKHEDEFLYPHPEMTDLPPLPLLRRYLTRRAHGTGIRRLLPIGVAIEKFDDPRYRYRWSFELIPMRLRTQS